MTLSQTKIEWSLNWCKGHAKVAQMAREMNGRIIYCGKMQYRTSALNDTPVQEILAPSSCNVKYEQEQCICILFNARGGHTPSTLTTVAVIYAETDRYQDGAKPGGVVCTTNASTALQKYLQLQDKAAPVRLPEDRATNQGNATTNIDWR